LTTSGEVPEGRSHRCHGLLSAGRSGGNGGFRVCWARPSCVWRRSEPDRVSRGPQVKSGATHRHALRAQLPPRSGPRHARVSPPVKHPAPRRDPHRLPRATAAARPLRLRSVPSRNPIKCLVMRSWHARAGEAPAPAYTRRVALHLFRISIESETTISAMFTGPLRAGAPTTLGAIGTKQQRMSRYGSSLSNGRSDTSRWRPRRRRKRNT
jgi:hypothetical protein